MPNHVARDYWPAEYCIPVSIYGSRREAISEFVFLQPYLSASKCRHRFSRQGSWRMWGSLLCLLVGCSSQEQKQRPRALKYEGIGNETVYQCVSFIREWFLVARRVSIIRGSTVRSEVSTFRCLRMRPDRSTMQHMSCYLVHHEIAQITVMSYDQIRKHHEVLRPNRPLVNFDSLVGECLGPRCVKRRLDTEY